MPERLEFFPIDITYKVSGGKPVIYLFGKTKNNEQVCVIDENFKPYFYAIPKEGKSVEEKLKKLKVVKNKEISEVIATERIKKKFLGKDVEAIKIYTKLPRDVPIIRDIIKDWDSLKIVTEYDIQFKKRYLIDKNITPLMILEAEGEFIKERLRVPVLKAEKISQKKEIFLEKPRILAFDIETYNPEGKIINPEKNPIIMLSLYGEGYKKVITWKKFKKTLDYIEFVDNEAELIEKFKEIINNYKPDILTGYFSDDFDLPYIKTRADKHKIKLDIGLDFSELSVKRSKTVVSNIVGINHLDIFRFIKKVVGPSMDVFALNLNAIASELINENKIEIDLDKLAETWDNSPNKLEQYCKYNLQDSFLTFELTKKMLPTILELVKIVGLPIYEINRSGFSQLVESYLLKQAQRFNEIAPELPHHEELRKRMLQTYKGAFVFEPKPGLYEKIVVFDYRSLYPSIISTHNIDPGTLNCPCCKDKVKPVPIQGKKIWFCSKRKGFIPALIEDLISRRMRIKKIMKEKHSPLMEARSQSLKLLANSFYGYMGFPMARWYCLDCAKATTAYGRYYIHEVINKAKEEGFNVIYSDTDSVFLTLKNKTKKEAEEFKDKINMKLPSLMELEFEGFYSTGIFVSAKASKLGAKKKYALLSEGNKLKIRGFETVRRNWSPIAKEVQEKVLSIILKEKDPKKALKYTKEIINSLRKNAIPIDKVTISVQLQKDIKSYDSIGPHVAVAERMKKKGHAIGPGSIIEFVVVKGEKRIRDRARLPEEVKQEDYDPDYYIKNQIIPSVEKIFEVLGYTKEDLLESLEQKKLGRFF